MVTCAACADHGRGEAQAAGFVRSSRWSAALSTFVDAGVYPLCFACLKRRREMVSGSHKEIPWNEAIAEWTLEKVHES